MKSPRTGRRPGAGTARTDILDTAREIFAREGFRGTTVRAVASAAGVDPALITHYFGSKQGLFEAAIDLPFEPSLAFSGLVAGPRDGIGERIVRFFLATWTAESGHALPTLVRIVVNEPAAARTLERLLIREGLGPALAAAGFDQPELRAALIASQLVGAGLLRFILGMEPLAALPEEHLVAWLAPAIQRYATGPLPGGLAAAKEQSSEQR